MANIYHDGVLLKITLSIGIATPGAVDELTAQNLTFATKHALHIAIEQGRNQVVDANSC